MAFAVMSTSGPMDAEVCGPHQSTVNAFHPLESSLIRSASIHVYSHHAYFGWHNDQGAYASFLIEVSMAIEADRAEYQHETCKPAGIRLHFSSQKQRRSLDTTALEASEMSSAVP